MHPRKIQINSFIIAGLFTIALITHLALYLFYLLGQIFNFGNALYGLSIFSFLALFIFKNSLHRQIWNSKWLFFYFMYITISFMWGYSRFGTITTAVYDLWLLSYLGILVLIPPLSFSARTFDIIVSFFICLYVVICLILISLYPDILFNRDLFSEFIRYPGMLAAGAVYLLLKYVNKLSLFTIVGLVGILADGMIYGVAGAYRGRLVLSLLALSLFILLILKSTKINFGFKFLSAFTSLILCFIALFIVSTKLEDQLINVGARFEAITIRYEQTGEITASDSRLREFRYFRSLNSDRKLIFGHGIGALWYDLFGMYGAEAGGSFAGARTMLHINWAHLLFKIGIVGFSLLLIMLISHWRRYPMFIRNNLSWWAFVVYYIAYSTYYGDKELTIRALVLLMVLVHPWLFKTFELSRKELTKLRYMSRPMGQRRAWSEGRRAWSVGPRA
jgi:hypothetical protein